MKKMEILVVHKNYKILNSIGDILYKQGYVVDTTIKAYIALSMVRTYKYDLVFFGTNIGIYEDYVLMPEMIKVDNDLTCVLILGNEKKEYLPQALEDGAFDYIRLPVDKNKLLDIVNKKSIIILEKKLLNSHKDTRGASNV